MTLLKRRSELWKEEKNNNIKLYLLTHIFPLGVFAQRMAYICPHSRRNTRNSRTHSMSQSSIVHIAQNYVFNGKLKKKHKLKIVFFSVLRI